MEQNRKKASRLYDKSMSGIKDTKTKFKTIVRFINKLTYLVKSLAMPVGTSFCLEGPIPYDIATTDIHITATPASGTAAYSVSIDYSPVLKRI